MKKGYVVCSNEVIGGVCVIVWVWWIVNVGLFFVLILCISWEGVCFIVIGVDFVL